ncbi:MAG: hypothetical protein Q8O42_20425, partial [Acidobacteriota bacterium]|nr:hypothetical protein [Acidobacteriota bacterium]
MGSRPLMRSMLVLWILVILWMVVPWRGFQDHLHWGSVQWIPFVFIRVKTLGGVLDQALPDQRWTILGRKGPVMAVSGLRTTHVLPPAQRT